MSIPISADSVRSLLERAATTPDADTRAAVVADIDASYGRLLAKINQIHKGRSSWSEEQFQKEIQRNIVGNDSKGERMAAAKQLAAVYGETYRTAMAVAESETLMGGRSGRVAYASKGTWLEINPRLEGLVDELFGTQETPPVGRSPSCRAKGYRVDVRKPADSGRTTGAPLLEPDFVAYLRRQDRTELLSLDAWVRRVDAAADESPDDPAVQQGYDVALAAEWEAFERSLYEHRYCQPTDLPAGSSVRGYRLLRLDTQLCAEDFRPQSEGQTPRIYEGHYGPPAPPMLDYGELVRRYVDQLRQEAAPASRPIGDTEIAEIVAAFGFAPDRTALFVQASSLALHLHDLGFWEEIVRRFGSATGSTASQPARIPNTAPGGLTLVQPTLPRPAPFGAPSAGTGPSATSPATWLLGSEGQEIRAAVERLWRSLLPESSAGRTDTAIGIPEAAIAASEMRARLERLTLAPGNPPLGQRNDFYPQNEAGGLGERIRAGLSNVYEAVWNAARTALGDEGLRARMLAPPELQIEFGPREFETWLFHTARLTYQHYTFLGREYDQVTSDLSSNPPAPIDFSEVEAFLGIDSGSSSPFPLAGGSSSPPPSWETVCNALINRLVSSYQNALDAVMTLSPATEAASSPPPSPAAPSSLNQSDIPTLYHYWAQLFWRIVDRLLAVRLPMGEDLLVLRLAKRSGRFGEVPRRSQRGELKPEPKTIPWPSHPRTKTESWMLEPVSEPYYRRHHPGFYLQELYALNLRHRGFGTGRNLYSVSLLPEEEQKIVIKSFKDTTYAVTESTAENVFEEATSETERDFGEEVSRASEKESTGEEAGHIASSISGGVPFFSGSIDASYDAKSGTRDFAKDVSNVTTKLASKLSAKQSVSVETKRTSEQKVELHAELTTERTIKNPNMGHTVTFNWFQMTRKYSQRLELEDARLSYTSGKYNVARILVPDGAAVPVRLRELSGVLPEQLDVELVSTLPPDVAARLPAGVAVVILTDPYHEILSMASTNAFLAKVLRPAKAVEIGSTLWRLLGESESAPDGIGVLAFSEPHGQKASSPAGGNGHSHWVELFSGTPERAQQTWAGDRVAADRIEIIPKWDGSAVETIYLPNLDLRHKIRDGQPPSRYLAGPHDAHALPRLLGAEERIVSTNGVYCDAMVGRCSALEDYLQRHRDLDLLEKKIQVGKQEIELRWQAEKDGLDVVLHERDETLLAVVAPRDGQQSFGERLQLEHAQLAESRHIAEDEMGRQRQQAELDILRHKVAQLQARLGLPPEVKIDAPAGSNVAVEAKINIDADDDDATTLTVD